MPQKRDKRIIVSWTQKLGSLRKKVIDQWQILSQKEQLTIVEMHETIKYIT